MPRRAHILMMICTSALGLASCGKKAGVPKIAVDQSAAQPSSLDSSSQQGSLDPDLSELASGSLIDAGYELDVKSLLGITVCKGEVNLQFNPLFSQDGKMFDLPNSPVSCLLGLASFDLGELMGATAGPPPDGTDPIDLRDNVIGVKKLGMATFEPSRPMFPSFLATELDRLKRLHVVRKVTAADSKTGQAGAGFSSLKVTGYERSYSPPDLNFQFRDVITFEVINSGFGNIDKLSNFIFEKMEMKVSLDPIAVPYVFIQGRVSDFTGMIGGGEGGGGLLGGLLGGAGGAAPGIGGAIGGIAKVVKVEMVLNLQRMEGLDAMKEIDKADRDDEKDED